MINIFSKTFVYLQPEIYLTDGNAFLGKSIFNKKGEVWLKEHHKSAENYVNEFVKTLSASLNKKED